MGRVGEGAAGIGDPDRVAAALDRAQLVVVATGAGMSKESGIPTFRDAREGLWARYNPEELATREGFRENPARVWGWYSYRRGLIQRAEPHEGHRALVRLEELVPQLAVVTQNIDGLQQRAGSSAVVELHGSIHRYKCFDRDHPVELEAPGSDSDRLADPPACPDCGSPVRPDVVWFGEMLPESALSKAYELSQACDVMIAVGTSGLVQPAAGLPVIARAGGATVIEINTQPSGITEQAHVFLPGPAGTVLPALVERLKVRRSGRRDG